MRKIIAMLLAMTMLFTTLAVTASAAREEEFLSDVALIYKDSVEEAKAAIEGTEWKLFEQDLNPKADYIIDDGVYLIYKTSTNVEDAITDLRVMDMYGGFSISNYERELEKSRQEYLSMCKDIRVAASEFKALYEAGDRMAALAYRQMNYYKDVGETGKLMGDFFLNIPSDNALVTVMMEGNSIVFSNLLSLLAIGLSNEHHSLAQRVAELYAVRDTLTDDAYHDNAVILNKALTDLSLKIKRYDSLKDTYQLYDDTMSEEEYKFVKEFASVALLAESIQLGDVTLAGLLRKESWSLTDIYPLVAAFSAGQLGLIKMGAFELALKYATPSDSVDELNEVVGELEKKLMDESGNIKHIDVYVGVDREIFKGSFAMTTAAERRQALTGETWNLGSAASESLGFYIAGGILAVLDVVSWCCFAYTLSNLPASATFYGITYEVFEIGGVALQGSNHLAFESMTVSNAWNATGIWFWTAIGLALIAAGLTGISTWYNYYNPDYTEIPNTLIDVRETDLGDRYIKYTAAKVYGDDGKKNADFNAYEGKEWIALYYTKDATAGNCLTPKFVYKDNDATIARRHQGISMFGETEAFNLNSHVYAKNAPGVYVTVRYSTTEKAAADMPSVVGSMFATGAFYALAAVGGAGLGIGGTVLVQNLKKRSRKKSEDEATPEAD